MSTMPQQKPGKSEQSVKTPPEFIQAVKLRLNIGLFIRDLAADYNNTQAAAYFDEASDSLKQDWTDVIGWQWCNPPYADITSWVKKAQEAASTEATIAMLIPASVGSNWWANHVHNSAYVAFLSPRLTFVGHTAPYPKDLALLLYAPYLTGGYCTWRWK